MHRPALRRPAALVGLVTTLLATLLAVAPASQAAEPLVVTGTVTDVAGKPLQGMTVAINRANGSYRTETVTLANGSFSIRALGAVPTPGPHILSVSDPSKRLDTFTSKRFNAGNVPTFAIRLRAARGVIRGTIAPQLDGATIKVPVRQVLTLDLIKVAPDGSQTSTPHTADTDGASFAMDPVEPGTYRLRFAGLVGVVPWMPVIGRSWRDNLPYKGRCWGASGVATTVADCATAPTFTVVKGRFTNLGATTFDRHFGALSGTLHDRDGKPVAQGEVYFRMADAPYTLVDEVDVRKGDWIMPRLPVGDYIASDRFNGPWFGGPAMADATRLTVADDTVVRDIDLVAR